MNTTLPALPNDSALLEEQVRQRAYFLWLDRGCPQGEDWGDWFAAKQQVAAVLEPAPVADSPRADDPSSHFSIKNTLAAHLSDPTHRFHAPETAHDARTDVVAGEARQRVRGRHFDSSLRAQPKKSK